VHLYSHFLVNYFNTIDHCEILNIWGQVSRARQ